MKRSDKLPKTVSNFCVECFDSTFHKTKIDEDGWLILTCCRCKLEEYLDLPASRKHA